MPDKNKPETLRLSDGQVLFKKGEAAEALYIIQSGQLRTFVPRSRGDVEFSVMRKGQVIGEVAYFDEEFRRRTFSAASIGDSLVIEISFDVLDQAISKANPWLRALFPTLVDHLKEANKRLKELNSFSLSWGATGAGEYVFFSLFDVVRIMTTLTLVGEVFGKKDERGKGVRVTMKHLRFYFMDCYLIPESKFEELLLLLKKEDMIRQEEGAIMHIRDLESMKMVSAFFSLQRSLDAHERLEISEKCEHMLDIILMHLADKPKSDPVRVQVDIKEILALAANRELNLTEADLEDAIAGGICEELAMSRDNRTVTYVDYVKLQRLRPSIRLLNAIGECNKAKGSKKRY